MNEQNMNVDFAGRSVNSQSQEWCTPKKYADLIDKFFNGSLELDPCSNENSIIKSKIKFCLPYKDGLHEEWKCKSIFVNPPYGADRIRKTTIKDWFSLIDFSSLASESEADKKYCELFNTYFGVNTSKENNYKCLKDMLDYINEKIKIHNIFEMMKD